MARKRVVTPYPSLGLNQPARDRFSAGQQQAIQPQVVQRQPVAKRRVRRRRVPPAPLFQTYSGIRPWTGRAPSRRPAKQPLFMRYSGLGLNQPARDRFSAAEDPRQAMRQEGERQRTHQVGMAREARTGALIQQREDRYYRALEQRLAQGPVSAELNQQLRKAYGLGGIAAPARPQQFGEYSTPTGRDQEFFDKQLREGAWTREGAGGRAMPGKVTGTQQTIYGALPRNYYERQREMMGRGLVYVRSMNKWMTPEMRDELSRHKWGQITQDRIDRINAGEDVGYFRTTTPSGESIDLSGAEMRAITAMGKGGVPEGLSLTPDQAANIRNYFGVVERGGEAARLEQAEGEYERQLDRLGEWQDVAAPLQRELGSEYGAMVPGTGRAGDVGIPRDRLGSLQLTEEELASPLMREYRGRVTGMGGIREQLMDDAVRAAEERDRALAAQEYANPDFYRRLQVLRQVPGGEARYQPATQASQAREWSRMPLSDEPLGPAQPSPRAELAARLDMPGAEPSVRPVPQFAEAPLPPVSVGARPDWLSPTDDLMVDERAWLQRLEPHLPKPEPALPGIPKEEDVGQWALKQQKQDKQIQDAVVSTPGVSQLLMGGKDVVAAVNDLRSLMDRGMTLPQINKAVQGLLAEAAPAVAKNFSTVLSHLGRPAPGAALPAAGPTGAAGQPPSGIGKILTGIVGQAKGGRWNKTSAYTEPIIAAMTDQDTQLGWHVSSLIEAARANPTPAAKKHIIDTVYNLVYKVVLEDLKTKPMNMPHVGLLPPVPSSWLPGGAEQHDPPFHREGASNVAGAVNEVLQKMIFERLGI